MTTAWRYSVLLCLGSLVILFAGVRLQEAARQQSGLPQGLAAARQALEESGGEEGIRQRLEALTRIETRLQGQLAAKRGNANQFSQRLEAAFNEFDLSLDKASDWQPLNGVQLAQGVAFERSFNGRGLFADLLGVLATFESWPDQPTVRELNIEPVNLGFEGDGRSGEVRFDLVLAVVRLPAEKDGARL